MSGRGFAAVLAAVFVGYVGLAGWLPPVDDELYYWCWSKDLQLSYYDHPPMTALMIRASTAVFGDTLFAVRLPACVAMTAVLGVVGWLTRSPGVLAGVVFTPLYTFGAVLVTPDTPLLLFWALYLAWLVAVHRRLTPGEEGDRHIFDVGRPCAEPAAKMCLSPSSPVPGWLWAVGGVLLGCGILGKYTTGLAVPAGLLSFLLLGRSECRRWAVGYAVHLAVAFVVASPILIYNIRNDFTPLLYQWHHATATGEPGVKPLAEFVGTQVVLVGTLPLVLFPWVVWRFRALTADPRLRVCVCLYGLPMAFFTLKASRGPLEGNWALAGYLAFWPLAAAWFAGLDQLSGKWRGALRWGGRAAFLPPATCAAVLGVHLLHPLPLTAPERDRVSRLPSRDGVMAALAGFRAAHPDGLPVFTDSYQTAALLRFHGVPAKQEAGVSRPSHFTQRPERMRDHAAAYYFGNGAIEELEGARGAPGAFAGHVAGFGPPVLVAEFPQVVRGVRTDTYKLWLYRKPAGHALAGPPAGSTHRPPEGVFTIRP